MTAVPSERYYVLFTSSFRRESSPNISHETIDKVRTLCGRKVADAATFEPDSNNLEPDCRICAKAVAKLKPKLTRDAADEAQLKCEACLPDHALGQLRPPCKVSGCECWCNR
jgi:hypothetical protein